MAILQDRKRSSYRDDDLAVLMKDIDEYCAKARDKESQSIADLEKHLWLANGAAATASIGFMQSKSAISCAQYLGACMFVLGIALLVGLKITSTIQSSRMRYRVQDSKIKFETDQETDFVFKELRDKTFETIRAIYLWLQWGSALAFVSGLVFTLIGIRRAV